MGVAYSHALDHPFSQEGKEEKEKGCFDRIPASDCDLLFQNSTISPVFAVPLWRNLLAPSTFCRIQMAISKN